MKRKIDIEREIEYGDFLKAVNKAAAELGWTTEKTDEFDHHARLNLPWERFDYAGTKITLREEEFKKAQIKVYRQDLVDHFYFSRKNFTSNERLEEYLSAVKRHIGPKRIIIHGTGFAN